MMIFSEIKFRHDDFFRNKIQITKVENISITQLINDERILKGKCAFEIFFEKVKTN